MIAHIKCAERGVITTNRQKVDFNAYNYQQGPDGDV